MAEPRIDDNRLFHLLDYHATDKTIDGAGEAERNLALDLNDERNKVRRMLGMGGYRLVRVTEGFDEWFAARDEDGCRLTVAWGEPDIDGIYNPTITRHQPPMLRILEQQVMDLRSVLEQGVEGGIENDDPDWWGKVEDVLQSSVDPRDILGEWSRVDRYLAEVQRLIDGMLAANDDSQYGLLQSAKEHVVAARGDIDADTK